MKFYFNCHTWIFSNFLNFQNTPQKVQFTPLPIHCKWRGKKASNLYLKLASNVAIVCAKRHIFPLWSLDNISLRSRGLDFCLSFDEPRPRQNVQLGFSPETRPPRTGRVSSDVVAPNGHEIPIFTMQFSTRLIDRGGRGKKKNLGLPRDPSSPIALIQLFQKMEQRISHI